MLAFPVLLLVVVGVLFFLDGQGYDVFLRERAKESMVGSAAMLGVAVFILILYSMIIPRSIAVAQDGVVLRFRAFSWKIPFRKIKAISSGTIEPSWRAQNFATSFRGLVEIVKTNGVRIRVSPSRPDLFLEYATRALEEWRTYHPDGLLP